MQHPLSTPATASAAPGRRARASVRRAAAAAVALLALVGATACSDDGPGDGGVDGGTSSTDPAASTGGAAEGIGAQASVAALAAELDAAGYPCALEYEGLRDGDKELSLCTIGGEQVTLSIWFDEAQLEAFRETPAQGAPGVTVIGDNWTVDLADPTLADALAGDLGAEVRAG